MAKVSVIMPCFNHATFLAESAQSVLRQTHGELELILVDDRSTDHSWSVIEALARSDSRVHAVPHQRNEGQSAARNNGLRLATGAVVAFCDADDVWEPDKLVKQLDFLASHPKFGIVYCDATIVHETGEDAGQRFSDLYPTPARPSGDLFLTLLERNFINIAGVAVKAECCRRIGGFDQRIRNVEDWWYWLQLSREYLFGYVDEPLVRYRVHSRSTNVANRRGYVVNRFRVYRRVLRDFTDLPRPQRAETVYQMGVELCAVGRVAVGRRLLLEAIRLSAGDTRCLRTLMRALRRFGSAASTTLSEPPIRSGVR
jgi:glycosyltransferase involved in cell wall biosynthesis